MSNKNKDASDFNKIEKEAKRILREFYPGRLPVDPEYVAERMGIDVVFAEFDDELSKKILGFIDMRESPRIIVNSEMPTNSKIFTIAHELGHFVLHKEYAESEDYEILARTNSSSSLKPKEEEADAFAAGLLVPFEELKKYKDYASIHELSIMFMVSKSVIKDRLLRLEQLSLWKKHA